MSQLLSLVGPSSSPDAVDGGMRVLLDFVGVDLTEDQLLPIAREMLPQLLNILGSPQVREPLSSAQRSSSDLPFCRPTRPQLALAQFSSSVNA